MPAAAQIGQRFPCERKEVADPLTRTWRPMQIAGQARSGSGFWHVLGSSDGRFAPGDDFSRSLYLVDRATHAMILLTTGHKTTAADHPHPTVSRDDTRIEIQSAMLSSDGGSMNICIAPVPAAWLKRAAP
jgi:oligogalacturonide lyase